MRVRLRRHSSKWQRHRAPCMLLCAAGCQLWLSWSMGRRLRSGWFRVTVSRPSEPSEPSERERFEPATQAMVRTMQALVPGASVDVLSLIHI